MRRGASTVAVTLIATAASLSLVHPGGALAQGPSQVRDLAAVQA
jgi:hypothetical protein